MANIKKHGCLCGKEHTAPTGTVLTGSGAVHRLPEVLKKLGAQTAFVLTDENTFRAAGEKVCAILKGANIGYTLFTLPDEMPEPDEKTVGSVIMHYRQSDAIIGVGSGVINDTCKLLAGCAAKPYIIAATAPSMDGYASATSSMTRGGLKISLDSKAADAIIGDTDILKEAPKKLLISGLGDMLAKYVSICEWRIAHLITGEYYCEEIASLVREALKKCVDNTRLLLNRDKEAVNYVFEGLVNSGMAMAYAGVSRPASGVEHYMSHIWDMRHISLGTPAGLHGIQCALGTYIAAGLYEKLKKIKPDREKALDYVRFFDYGSWASQLRVFLGKSAESMIELEKTEQKYSLDRHAVRLGTIIEKWDGILDIIDRELPPQNELKALYAEIGAPTRLEDIGLPNGILPMTFKATKDIRDKYVLSRLAWDIGIIDEIV